MLGNEQVKEREMNTVLIKTLTSKQLVSETELAQRLLIGGSRREIIIHAGRRFVVDELSNVQILGVTEDMTAHCGAS